MVVEGGDQGVAPPAVAGPAAAQVAVVGAGAEQVGQGELLQVGHPRSSAALARASAGHSDRGGTTQPMRSAGARVLLTDPA